MIFDWFQAGCYFLFNNRDRNLGVIWSQVHPNPPNGCHWHGHNCFMIWWRTCSTKTDQLKKHSEKTNPWDCDPCFEGIFDPNFVPNSTDETSCSGANEIANLLSNLQNVSVHNIFQSTICCSQKKLSKNVFSYIFPRRKTKPSCFQHRLLKWNKKRVEHVHIATWSLFGFGNRSVLALFQSLQCEFKRLFAHGNTRCSSFRYGAVTNTNT